MRVSWTAPSAECQFEVEFWRADGAGPRGKVGEVAAGETYGPHDMCGPSPATDPANFRDPGFFFHAEMAPLDPATHYNYSVTGFPAGAGAGAGAGTGTGPDLALREGSGAGSGAAKSSTSLSWFWSAPAPGGPFSMVTFMDVGEPFDAEPHSPGGFAVTTVAGHDVLASGSESRATAPASPHPYSLVLHSGDLSYARGEGEVWERWMDMIEPLSSHAPYMVSMGNHECLWAGPSSAGGGWGPAPDFRPIYGQYGNDSGGECCIPAAHRFSAMPGGVLGQTPSPLYQDLPPHEPSPSADANPPYWYSFDYGAAHFVIFSTEHDFTPGSKQLEWVERDLASVNRAKTPWVIGSAHRPAYTSFVMHDLQPVSLALAMTIEPLLAKYDVNLMLYGHVHTHERTCPLRDAECVGSAMGGGGRLVELRGGTVHLTVGCGGHSLNLGIPVIKSGWSEAVHVDFGYGRLEVLNGTHAAWEFVRVQRGDAPGTPAAPEVLERTVYQRA